MLYWLRTVFLLPVIAFQALNTRRRALILPEPSGERMGETGSGPSLRLLIAGDSAAAGVGADHQDNALLGCVVRELCKQHKVRWRLEARSGVTTRQTISHLQGITPEDIDIATTSLGVNDITSGRGPRRWLREQAELRQLLRDRFGARLIIVAGLPPVHLFPGIPQPLRWHLGLRAKEFDAALARRVETEPDCRFVPLNVSDDVSGMADDGFHPGPHVYKLWAGFIAEHVRRSWRSPTL